MGAGLIGGSLALSVRKRLPDVAVTVVDPDPAVTQRLAPEGITVMQALDDALPAEKQNEPAPVDDLTLVVLATHLPKTLELLAEPHWAQQPHLVITDVASCKRPIVEAAGHLHNFVPGHPMAGKERSGIAYANADLFAGKPYLLCPVENQPAMALVETLAREGLGAHTFMVDADKHDAAMAYVSHLPQLYATVLCSLLATEAQEALPYHGGGIDGQVRLGASPYAMWGPVFAANADNITLVLDHMIAQLSEAREALGRLAIGDQEAMASHFATANALHAAFQQHQPKVWASLTP